MKKVIAFGAVFLLCLSAVDALAEAPAKHPKGVNARQHHQKDRIRHGVKSGELTRRETHRLVDGQKRIQKMESHFRSDGELSQKEKARLQHNQNKQSKAIYRQKHDEQDRPGNSNRQP